MEMLKGRIQPDENYSAIRPQRSKAMSWYIIIFYGFLLTPRATAGNFIPNVALSGQASQSSVKTSTASAPKAINGQRSTHFDYGSCTLTDRDNNPWWRLDLLRTYTITAVVITSSRTEEYSLDGVQVWVGSSLDQTSSRVAEILSFPAGRSLYLPLDGVEGQFVTVVLPGNERMLCLCEVEVYSTDYAHPLPNVAVKGEATQSSTLFPASAYRASDGRRDTFYTEGSCSHTEGNETGPWWRVDLGQTYVVTTVKVTNRGDCCSERLDGAQIRIGDSLENNGNDNPRCANISHIPLGNTFSFSCEKGSMEGRYVNVLVPGEFKTLTLCEVEVYATPTVKPLENVASYKTTAQSSTARVETDFNSFTEASSWKAVGRCGIHKLDDHCCIQTVSEEQPWFRVDLGTVTRVSAVTVFTREDCCRSKIIGAQIRIGNSPNHDGNLNPTCAVINSTDLIQTFQCSAMEGRFVNVVLNRTTSLTFCRIEVYGSPVEQEAPPAPSPPPSFNFPTVSVQLGGRSVTLVGGRLCWSDALLYCRQYHWDLLSVYSQSEQTEVEKLLSTSPFQLTDYVWLGLRRDLMGQRWFWMSGDPVIFKKWRRMLSPVYQSPCGVMVRAVGLSWQPQPCDHLYNFICQTAPMNAAGRVYYYSHKNGV